MVVESLGFDDDDDDDEENDCVVVAFDGGGGGGGGSNGDGYGMSFMSICSYVKLLNLTSVLLFLSIFFFGVNV